MQAPFRLLVLALSRFTGSFIARDYRTSSPTLHFKCFSIFAESQLPYVYSYSTVDKVLLFVRTLLSLSILFLRYINRTVRCLQGRNQRIHSGCFLPSLFLLSFPLHSFLSFLPVSSPCHSPRKSKSLGSDVSSPVTRAKSRMESGIQMKFWSI